MKCPYPLQACPAGQKQETRESFKEWVIYYIIFIQSVVDGISLCLLSNRNIFQTGGFKNELTTEFNASDLFAQQQHLSTKVSSVQTGPGWDPFRPRPRGAGGTAVTPASGQWVGALVSGGWGGWMDVWRWRIAAIAKLYVRRDQAGHAGYSRLEEGRQVGEGRGWGKTTEVGKKNINRELDGCAGTESRRPALDTSRVPSRGLVSAPNQLQGCSRSGLELSPSELVIMKKHSARVAPLSACNSPVLTLTKVEGRESSHPASPMSAAW